MKLSLIVPCFNEEGNIRPLYDAVTQAFDGRITDYEFVFINDGSRDNTAAVLKDLVTASDVPMKVINFSRNFGKESGIYAGLHYTDGDYITVMDGDLQQTPDVILDMVDYLDAHDECDCVAAFQEDRSEQKVLIFFKNAFYKIINSLSDTEFRMGASDFRTFRRSVGDAILSMPEYHRFSKGIFSWVGFHTHFIPYTAEDRHSGTTKWSFTKLWRYAWEGILAFSTKPLELPLWGGLGLSALSLCSLGRASAKKQETKKTNWLIALFGSLNLTASGLLGLYLSKTYEESKDRPIYLVRDVLTNEPEHED